MPFGYLTCVLRTHFKEVFDIFIIYSIIKTNDVTPANKIWISVEMNDVNYDVDRTLDIYSCFKADVCLGFVPLEIFSHLMTSLLSVKGCKF